MVASSLGRSPGARSTRTNACSHDPVLRASAGGSEPERELCPEGCALDPERVGRGRGYPARMAIGRRPRPERIEPGPGQESVWDYPRPPRVEPAGRRIRVEHGGRTVADTTSAWRVLETSQPPAYYLPPDDVDRSLLRPSSSRTVCEWKGAASYWDLVVDGAVVADAAWSYPSPTPRFEPIRDHLAFYAQKVDGCFVDDERVVPNEGSFYGGWITSWVVGPFKGAPGTMGW